MELSSVCAKATREAGVRRLTGTNVHWKPQPHLRSLAAGAHVKAAHVSGRKAAQRRADGRYAILIDWRGVAADKADKAVQAARAQAHKKKTGDDEEDQAGNALIREASREIYDELGVWRAKKGDHRKPHESLVVEDLEDDAPRKKKKKKSKGAKGGGATGATRPLAC